MVYYSCIRFLAIKQSGINQLEPDRWPNQLIPNYQSPLICGPREIRTLDLLNAIETRSQLRYGPMVSKLRYFTRNDRFRQRVDLEGFEPSTSSVRLKRAPNCATGPDQAIGILS